MNKIRSQRDHSLVKIRHNLQSGDLGYLIYLHGILYAKEYGFNLLFEIYVAENLVKFVYSMTDREKIWIVEKEGKVVGSLAIVSFSEHEAQLRWLLLHPNVRGQGIGRTLINQAVNFCKKCNYSSVFLWTVSTLTIASQLYKSMGFKKTEEKTHKLWGKILTEERYDLKLSDNDYS